MNKEYMDENEAVKYLASIGISVSVHKLRKDRSNGKGFPYHKVDLKVYYSKVNIDSYIEASKITPKS